MLGLRIIGDFGAIIAVPVVALSWIGKTLDSRYGTAPLLLVSGFALSAALSAFGIVRKAKAFGKEFDELNRQHDDAVRRNGPEGEGGGPER